MNSNQYKIYYIVKSITYFALINTNNSFKYSMLNLFNNKQNGFNYKSSITSLIEKNTKIQSNSERNEHKNTIDYPFASKEWETSIYSYNKYYNKHLISYNAVLNNLVKIYYNMSEYITKIDFKSRRDNKTRY